LAHTIWNNTESTSNRNLAPVDISKLMLLDDDRSKLYTLLGKLVLGKAPSEGLKIQADYLLDERERASSETRAEELLFLFVSSPEAAVQR